MDIIFTERIVNVWRSLSDEVDFSTVKSFTRTIKHVSFNDFVSYYGCKTIKNLNRD